jgi:hypothetical protein
VGAVDAADLVVLDGGTDDGVSSAITAVTAEERFDGLGTDDDDEAVGLLLLLPVTFRPFKEMKLRNLPLPFPWELPSSSPPPPPPPPPSSAVLEDGGELLPPVRLFPVRPVNDAFDESEAVIFVTMMAVVTVVEEATVFTRTKCISV